MRPAPDLRIAAIVPCHNEESTVEKVVEDLGAAVPGMDIYVYDNRSTDRTYERAVSAGAIVRREERKGKGNVLRRAFADIEADIYVMIDGDDTYETADLPGMIETLVSGSYDHVLGVRDASGTAGAYRPGHEAGNRMFNRMVGGLFHESVSDMLSGYRVMSRRFVKSFPAVSRQFEIETEFTVHIMSLRIPTAEHLVGFRDRPDGSESKLNTVSDGLRIVWVIAQLLRLERPNLFHGAIALVLLLAGLILGVPVIVEYFETGEVPRFPTAILASALMVLSALMGSIGFVVDVVRRARRETARLAYLALDPVAAPARVPRGGAAGGRDTGTA